MFGAPNLSQSKKNTQPLVGMVDTFRMSGLPLATAEGCLIRQGQKKSLYHFWCLLVNLVAFNKNIRKLGGKNEPKYLSEKNPENQKMKKKILN